jgi:drug/metabolite transporter (DMT)-like permease
MRVDGAQIDAGSFTVIRLASGVVALFTILWFKKLSRKGVVEITVESSPQSRGSWFGAITLFMYAFGFSYAYISLETGTGALILFGVVQMTMISASIYSGHRLHYSEWLGVCLAFIGFVYLMLPGVSAPSIQGLLLMSVSGIAWAGYTLAGKKTQDPLSDTSYNFLRTIPFIIALAIYNLDSYYLSTQGVLLAIASGALTSGVGYTIWYIALRSLKTMHAAVLQLLVPVIAAVGGVMFVDELLTTRILVASLLILGGILLVVVGKKILGNP